MISINQCLYSTFDNINEISKFSTLSTKIYCGFLNFDGMLFCYFPIYMLTNYVQISDSHLNIWLIICKLLIYTKSNVSKLEYFVKHSVQSLSTHLF